MHLATVCPGCGLTVANGSARPVCPHCGTDVMRQTFHPGVYDRPAAPPRFDARRLAGLLMRPRRAFEGLHDHTSAPVGVALAANIAALEGLASFGLLTAIKHLRGLPLEVRTGPFSYLMPGVSDAAGSLMLAVVSFSSYLLFGLLLCALLSLSRRYYPEQPPILRYSPRMTLGLLGYAKFPAMLMWMLMYLSAGLGANPDGNITLLSWGWTVQLALIAAAWSIWVQGHAVSVANDMPPKESRVIVAFTWFLVILVLFALMALIDML